MSVTEPRAYIPVSKRTDWETPAELFDNINAYFDFDIDVCATAENAKCPRYFTPEEDGLKQEWKGTCWMNPPYGRTIGRWVRKAFKASLEGATVVCLLPSRTDTGWWHDYCSQGEVAFLRGRLRFGGARHNAPFASAIVVFQPPVPESEFSGMSLQEAHHRIVTLREHLGYANDLYTLRDKWREESEELVEAMLHPPAILEEAADVLVVLTAILHDKGLTLDQPLAHALEKLGKRAVN